METPTRYIVQEHSDRKIIVKALPYRSRRDFLWARGEAWAILGGSLVANAEAALGIEIAIGGLLDSHEEFRFLVEKMLSLHGLHLVELDTVQITKLLFRDGDGDGLLVRLEFPPIPVDGEPVTGDPDLSPYATLIAVLAGSSGNYYQAKQAVDELSYPEITTLLKVLEEQFKRSQSAASGAIDSSKPKSLKDIGKGDIEALERVTGQSLKVPVNPKADPVADALAAVERFKAQQKSP